MKSSSLRQRWSLDRFRDFPVVLLLLAALYPIARQNYALFHSLVECTIMAVTFATFGFAWTSRRFESGYLLFLGLTCLPVGLCEMLHMLAYPGLGVFVDPDGTNLAAQLWLAGRIVLVTSLFTAPLYARKPRSAPLSLTLLLLFAAVLVTLIFTGHFPRAYVLATGLTPFKIGSEYAIIALTLAGLALLLRNRAAVPASTLWLLVAYYLGSAAASFWFTLYFVMASWPNMLGHYCLLLGAYAFYKAIFETGVSRPFDLLFRELTQAIRVRDEFLSIASHELKTPLTPIKLQLQGIRRILQRGRLAELPPEQLPKMIDTANRQLDRLTYLVDNLLDVSRITAGKLQLKPEPVDVGALLEEVRERHAGETRAAGATVELAVKGAPRVEADPVRLDQVLTNLFTNALKYAPGSRVLLGAEPTDDGGALIWVEDDGPGVPAAHQARIFDRFERVEDSPSATGLGLGLFISRQIVEAHGGALRLTSDGQHGSRFAFRLPARPPAPRV